MSVPSSAFPNNQPSNQSIKTVSLAKVSHLTNIPLREVILSTYRYNNKKEAIERDSGQSMRAGIQDEE